MIVILQLTGRLRSGNEGGRGRLYHAVEATGTTSSGEPYVDDADALCGATPGMNSVGWSSWPGKEVTCPRCLAKLAKRTTAPTATPC